MSVRSGSSSKYMSEKRREKLLGIQKREQLKGLLINKFKNKYGNKQSATIQNEVNKFLNNNRLTEENLKALDEKIQREADWKERQADALSEHMSVKSGARWPKSRGSQVSRRSQASRPRTVASQSKRSQHGAVDDVLSVKSYASSWMSGASGLEGRRNEALPPVVGSQPPIADDLWSESSKISHVHTQYSNLNEEDEWTAIQNFNTILHYEE